MCSNGVIGLVNKGLFIANLLWFPQKPYKRGNPIS
jgi:hypothetical protein